MIKFISKSTYLPILKLTRGESTESIHYGAVSVVNALGDLLAWYGDPDAVTFLRSTAKPFQVLPLIESSGHEKFNLTLQEISIICASHSGTDQHVSVVKGIQSKIGLTEADLKCGIHPPIHKPTALELSERGSEPSPIHNNCSGKHTGMLALARLLNIPTNDYINPDHPVQKLIQQTISEVCAIDPQEISLGTDGCSVPTFAVPLQNAALAYARLCDPSGFPTRRASGCRTITSAMLAHPEMVAGPGRFDTHLMQVAKGRILAKGGSEGYQGMGILPGALYTDSPGIGIAIKIADGDKAGRVKSAVALEVLRQIGALTSNEMESLCDFGITRKILNWREMVVGESKPCFSLQRASFNTNIQYTH